MALVNPKDLVVGQTIRFNSLSPHDNVLWTGIITAVCDYDTAKHFEDVDSYYQDVQRSVGTLATKESLTYILLKVVKNDLIPVMHAFALDWIDQSSLEVIHENSYTDIRIYDISTTKADDIRKYISALGYVAEVLQTVEE